MTDARELSPAESSFLDGLSKSATPDQHALAGGGLGRAPFASSGSRDDVPPAIDPDDLFDKEALAENDPNRVFLRADVSPTIYATLLSNRYGGDWMRWEEPETVWRTIERDAGLPDGAMHRVARDKVSAMRSLIHQEDIWERMDVFENAALAFNDKLATWDMIEGLEPEEISYFLRTARRLVNVPQPGYDVRRYVAGMLGERGWILAPVGCAVFQGDLDDYNSKLEPAELARLKQEIKTRLGTRLADDDESAVEVAVARHEKVQLYLRTMDARERRHRERFGVKS